MTSAPDFSATNMQDIAPCMVSSHSLLLRGAHGAMRQIGLVLGLVLAIFSSHCVAVQAEPAIGPVLQIDFDEQSLAKLGALYPGGRQIELIEGRNGRPAVKFFGFDRPGVIQIPNRPALQFTDGATFDFWVRLDGNVSTGAFDIRQKAANTPMTIFAKSGDRVGFAVVVAHHELLAGHQGGYMVRDQSFGSTGCAVIEPILVFAIGEWFRLTFVVSKKNGIRMYQNKILSFECLNARPNFSASNQQDLFIGRNASGWYPLHGAVQDLRVYSLALTEAQIRDLP